MENLEIARRLEEVAELLEAQHANVFRVQAYRRAAAEVGRLDRPLDQIWWERGEAGLRAVTGVGDRLATALRTVVTTGRLPMLDRLRGEADAVAILETVPGIGRGLAERLHDELEIDTLEDLEIAAHDGRLHDLAGVGAKKLAGIIDTLATRLGRIRMSGGPSISPEALDPEVEELLDVDREYREKDAAGELPKIAPHRFNPGDEAWLPILHTRRGERHYTAMFSNTARAHELGHTHDWVILYCEGPSHVERQATVITWHSGRLAGKRVVRGREAECERYYDERSLTVAPQ